MSFLSSLVFLAASISSAQNPVCSIPLVVLITNLMEATEVSDKKMLALNQKYRGFCSLFYCLSYDNAILALLWDLGLSS